MNKLKKNKYIKKVEVNISRNCVIKNCNEHHRHKKLINIFRCIENKKMSSNDPNEHAANISNLQESFSKQQVNTIIKF